LVNICEIYKTSIFIYVLGDIEWGCGFRPEMVRDKQHPGYWINAKYCPKHIHFENSQLVHGSTDKDDYDVVDCNVSR
jgi:hypothetical protein